jgi:hypothetical protein
MYVHSRAIHVEHATSSRRQPRSKSGYVATKERQPPVRVLRRVAGADGGTARRISRRSSKRLAPCRDRAGESRDLPAADSSKASSRRAERGLARTRLRSNPMPISSARCRVIPYEPRLASGKKRKRCARTACWSEHEDERHRRARPGRGNSAAGRASGPATVEPAPRGEASGARRRRHNRLRERPDPENASAPTSPSSTMTCVAGCASNGPMGECAARDVRPTSTSKFPCWHTSRDLRSGKRQIPTINDPPRHDPARHGHV